MKKKTLGIFAIAIFAMSTITLSSVVAVQAGALTVDPNALSTITTATAEGDVSRQYREDWYLVEDVEPGLMSVDLSWDNSMALYCYIATTASRVTPLASGTDSCSYTIATSGDYYVGVYLATKGRADTTPYTLEVTYYTGGGSDDIIDPIVDLTSPANGATVSDTITITATASDADSGMDYVTCNFGGTDLGPDSTSPYSWTYDTNTIGDDDYTITVTAYDIAGNSASDSIVVTTDNGYVPPPGEKIFVAFWASDAGTQTEIDKYWAYLQLEGYTKLFNFRDTADFEADFNTVDAYEDPDDTVFLYLFGHGNNNGVDSLTAFAPGTSVVYSSELRVMFDRLDAERVGYLIESCHSGGFPVDFHAEPYLAMSTSDEDHNSYALGALPGEGKFSYYFFEHVYDGYNAVEAFYYAENIVISEARNSRFAQYPLIADYSTYVWFA